MWRSACVASTGAGIADAGDRGVAIRARLHDSAFAGAACRRRATRSAALWPGGFLLSRSLPLLGDRPRRQPDAPVRVVVHRLDPRVHLLPVAE